MNAASSQPGSPVLSVTVTNYNYAHFLPEALDSILAQSFEDFELIVIDNASTDGSIELLAEYAERDPRVRLIAHQQNQGGLASLRESCDVARGRYRVQVDADDWVISPTAFAEQVDMLERHPAMAFVYSTMTRYGPDGSKVGVSRPYPNDTVLPGELALEAILSFALTHSGMMFRLAAYRSTAGYPDGLPHVDDMLLGVRLAEVGDVGYLDRELYAFRQHGANVHLAPQLPVVKEEILPVIEAAFEGPLGPRVPASVRRRVVRNALVHLPTQYIFAGQRRAGWRLYWESVKARPLATVAQLRTLSLLAVSVLGADRYRAMVARIRS
jgi:glycosyltransferase involved in cell wall biosynthesis